jgi:ketosteroid isomerase-like protein
MKLTCLVSLLVICLAAAVGAEERLNRAGLTIADTFDIYIHSIQNRDLEALMSTVTDGSEMVFLTTSGRLIGTVEGYRQFHIEWFAETGWRIEFEKLKAHEGSDYGYVLTKYHYEGNDEEGRRYQSDSFFTLIFHKEGGMWKVVQDQITPIRN